jgi:hypothetical protein
VRTRFADAFRPRPRRFAAALVVAALGLGAAVWVGPHDSGAASVGPNLKGRHVDIEADVRDNAQRLGIDCAQAPAVCRPIWVADHGIAVRYRGGDFPATSIENWATATWIQRISEVKDRGGDVAALRPDRALLAVGIGRAVLLESLDVFARDDLRYEPDDTELAVYARSFTAGPVPDGPAPAEATTTTADADEVARRLSDPEIREACVELARHARAVREISARAGATAPDASSAAVSRWFEGYAEAHGLSVAVDELSPPAIAVAELAQALRDPGSVAGTR